MATIIEIQEDKLKNLSEFAEKIVKYGKQLAECLEETTEEHYAERYGRGRKPYGFREHEWEDHRKEYPRYY